MEENEAGTAVAVAKVDESIARYTIEDMSKMAQAVAKSGLFGVKEPVQALALLLLAQAKGLHPMLAAERYHIIQGRASMKAEAMQAEFQRLGGKIKWITLTEKECEAEFFHPSGGTVSIRWDIDMAKRAGLGGKDNWKNYPRAMLRSRVVSEGIRTVCPGANVGYYTPEELMDFSDAPEVAETPKLPTTGTLDVAALKPGPPPEPKTDGKKKAAPAGVLPGMEPDPISKHQSENPDIQLLLDVETLAEKFTDDEYHAMLSQFEIGILAETSPGRLQGLKNAMQKKLAERK